MIEVAYRETVPMAKICTINSHLNVMMQSPTTFELDQMAVGFSEGPCYPMHFLHTIHFFAILPSEQSLKGSMQPL